VNPYPDPVANSKDSAGVFPNMEAMTRNFPDFRVFSSSNAYLHDMLRICVAGSITACNNIAAATLS
jgi:dihydrodipicolinate synthase/N-acetylneuraminate lyase